MSGRIGIDLWTWSLDVGPEERERLAGFLSEDERARAARYHFARDRERHVVARGRLRELLAARLSTSPAQLRFEYSAHGKPTLAPPGPRVPGGVAPGGDASCKVAPRAVPHFNLSHSHGLAALAICAEAELGLDIEAVRPLSEDIAGRFFSPREVAAYRALPEADRLPGFYRCWTRKEAVLKSLGDGLARPLDSFDVTLGADGPARIERVQGEPDAARTWALLAFVPAAGFEGAIALRAHGLPIDLRRAPSPGDG